MTKDGVKNFFIAISILVLFVFSEYANKVVMTSRQANSIAASLKS